MAYMNCPGCRASNKDADSKCYSCGQALQASAVTVVSPAGSTAAAGKAASPTSHFKMIVGALLSALLVLVMFGMKKEQAAKDRIWTSSLSEAQRLSEETGKPILMNFTGSDWCGWCIRLKDEVFRTQEFAAWANQNVILLEVDFPRRRSQSAEITAQNQELARKYGVRGFPTIKVVDKDGKVLKTSGYVPGGPEAFLTTVSGE